MKARNGTTSQCGTWRVIAVFAAILACALSLSATLFTSPALAEGDTLTVNFARYSVPDRVHDGFTDADTGTVLYCSDFYLHSPSTGTVLTKQGAAGITLDYLCYFGYGGAGYDDTVGIQGYTGNIARTITQQAIWMVIGSDTIAPSNGHGYPGTAASPLRSYDAEAEAFANEARANASDSAKPRASRKPTAARSRCWPWSTWLRMVPAGRTSGAKAGAPSWNATLSQLSASCRPAPSRRNTSCACCNRSGVRRPALLMRCAGKSSVC